jgi:hypothetical protein
MKKFILILFFSVTFIAAIADVIPKTYTVQRTSLPIVIDGEGIDSAWVNASIATDFVQLDPVEGLPASQHTEVKVLYDNSAVYVLAKMSDTHADSILHELGNRDEGDNLNTDAFRFGLDTYNKRQSGYVFEITASGVQSERIDDDLTFDAVWESAVKITADGWTAEIKIPYSAIRFPTQPVQTWAVQFARLIRRNREYDQWTLTPKNVQNRVRYWGTMNGITDIDPPVRLSLTPYLSLYVERAPENTINGKTGYGYSWSYSGGADIKYGINESFTLDMTLLPDFSQVQSDNKVKNLSAFETIYEERRPFFKEGTQLFSRGNLFYSRRIGKTPSLYFDVPSLLDDGETLEENPDKAKLLNATKISGRTQQGLGIGILNAVTNDTWAVIRKNDGSHRRILTEPLTNYNIFIFDQQLKNNSDIFLVNTNVTRNGKNKDANVTTLVGQYENEKHTYRISGETSQSRIRGWENGNDGSENSYQKDGGLYYLGANKISGTSYYGGFYEIGTKDYDKNDMGYIFIHDYSHAGGYYTYNKFNPFWKHFKQGYANFYFNRKGRLSFDNKLTEFNVGLNLFLLFNSNWSLYAELGSYPVKGRDFYETHIEGKFYRPPVFNFGSLNFTTDYNKWLAFDFGGRYNLSDEWGYVALGYYIIPIIRVSDKFNVKLSHYLDVYNNDRGFIYKDAAETNSYFGQRDIVTIVNTVTSRYLFKNDLSLSLTGRHYWSKGVYGQQYIVNNEGYLDEIISLQNVSAYNFNSNYFTVDVVFNWQFSPGSSFLVTYKNLILSETAGGPEQYFNNLSETLTAPQTNSLSLKVLYYLDYQYLKRKKK